MDNNKKTISVALLIHIDSQNEIGVELRKKNMLIESHMNPFSQRLSGRDSFRVQQGAKRRDKNIKAMNA